MLNGIEVGQVVTHTNKDCYLANSSGIIVWVHPSGLFCDVLFNREAIEIVKHPYLDKYFNRINHPHRIPTHLLIREQTP